jgi:hypothetical protein
MFEMYTVDEGVAPRVWYSGGTTHALILSNGSISRASFVSSFGLGVAGMPDQSTWQYAPVYDGNIDQNMVVAAGGSYNTLLCLYQTSGSVTGRPLYSYLTSAPEAKAVAAYDNYVVAFNLNQGGNELTTRVQWCVRGNPSNWTSEGSGFEDLLAMRGAGTAVYGLNDRLILFSEAEIWYGLSAAYPAQFTFYPLDRNVGCAIPKTIQVCEQGLIFVGSDNALRLLPHGGGPSTVIVPQITKDLRNRRFSSTGFTSSMWGLYDALTKVYHLFITVESQLYLSVNVETGEVGYMHYDFPPSCGVSLGFQSTIQYAGEGVLLADTFGQTFSTKSTLSRDVIHGQDPSFGTVTSTFRSGPLANDLPANWKQLTTTGIDYRATSRSTVTLKIAGDAFTYGSGVAVSLASAPVAGRASQDVYAGGMYPTIELTSNSTGYELHRLDVGMTLGGRGR